jgi:hypothetical protein
VLAVAYLLLAVAALAGAPVAVLVAVGLAAGADSVTTARQPKLAELLDRVGLGATPRLLMRTALVLVGVVVGLPGSGAALGIVLGAVVLLGARGAQTTAARLLRARSSWDVSWRNLAVPTLTPPAEPAGRRRLRAGGAALVDRVDVVVATATALLALGAPSPWPVAVVAVAAAAGIAVAWAWAERARTLPDRTRDEVLAAVAEAVERTRPRVVVHFGGPASSTHVLNVWVRCLERLDVPVLVVVRQDVHLAQLDSVLLPVVHAPRATDVEQLLVPSIGLALYPTNVAQNNHVIRVPGITDVFIGHGDSDKAGSATPLSRIYDEVWVAGPAGRERYREARVGVRDDQIREVGRPQLAEIAQLRDRAATPSPAHRFTVLYAPTWEGFYEAWSYSSVRVMGERLVPRLLQLDGVRVLVKLHPATGSVDPSYRAAARRISTLVREAGPPHRVLTGLTHLYTAFDEADVLVSDVSSVVTDFLWSGKPYVMTDPERLPEEEYRRRYPSSVAAAIWQPDLDTVEADLEDMRTVDRRRAERDLVARHLLGDTDRDPQERFAEAVHDALAHRARVPSGGTA